jgi:hypothetical protein
VHSAWQVTGVQLDGCPAQPAWHVCPQAAVHEAEHVASFVLPLHSAAHCASQSASHPSSQSKGAEQSAWQLAPHWDMQKASAATVHDPLQLGSSSAAHWSTRASGEHSAVQAAPDSRVHVSTSRLTLPQSGKTTALAVPVHRAAAEKTTPPTSEAAKERMARPYHPARAPAPDAGAVTPLLEPCS